MNLLKCIQFKKVITLGEIASKHHVSLAEVAELNNLTGDSNQQNLSWQSIDNA